MVNSAFPYKHGVLKLWLCCSHFSPEELKYRGTLDDKLTAPRVSKFFSSERQNGSVRKIYSTLHILVETSCKWLFGILFLFPLIVGVSRYLGYEITPQTTSFCSGLCTIFEGPYLLPLYHMSTKYIKLEVFTHISQKHGSVKDMGTGGSYGRAGCSPSAPTWDYQSAAQSNIHWNGPVDPSDSQRTDF